jgi:SPP1 family predicted phage head-tail adaptor
MLDIGRLRHRIVFLKPTEEEKNSFKESVPVYTEFASVRAAVEPMTGKEYAEAQKIRAETTYNITTRYVKGITSDMKIRFGEKEFDIVSILNIGERNEQLKIVASEKDINGKE